MIKKILATTAAVVGLATVGGLVWNKVADKKNKDDAAEFVGSASPEK